MNYKTGFAFTARDLFENFDSKRIDFPIKKLAKEKKININDKKLIIYARIFTYCIYLIILDIINNNITFDFPTRKRRVWFHMESFQDEDFKRLYSLGLFQHIDWIKSNFTANQLSFKYQTKDDIKSKKLYICNKLKDVITENTYKGKQYY